MGNLARMEGWARKRAAKKLLVSGVSGRFFLSDMELVHLKNWSSESRVSSDGSSFLRGCCHAHCADRRTWHASQGDELLSCELDLRGMHYQFGRVTWNLKKEKQKVDSRKCNILWMFANRTGPSCHLQCEQLGRCLSQLPRWEGFTAWVHFVTRDSCFMQALVGTCFRPWTSLLNSFNIADSICLCFGCKFLAYVYDWLSFFLAICLMGFLPRRVAKLSKDLHAADLTNEIVIPRNISVQGKLPTDDASISYQNTISIGFHGWNDMQRPSTLRSAVWPETMEVSLPCTSPAAPRVIRAPLLSQGSRTTARA